MYCTRVLLEDARDSVLSYAMRVEELGYNAKQQALVAKANAAVLEALTAWEDLEDLNAALGEAEARYGR